MRIPVPVVTEDVFTPAPCRDTVSPVVEGVAAVENILNGRKFKSDRLGIAA